MTRDEFLAKLFVLYASSFNKSNGQAWVEAYKSALKANIDYDKLYDYVLCHYASATAPSPAYLIKNAEYIKPKNAEEILISETLIVQKGNYTYEYGVKLADYVKDIAYFQKNGFQIKKLKLCEKNCRSCNYQDVCISAKEEKVSRYVRE